MRYVLWMPALLIVLASCRSPSSDTNDRSVQATSAERQAGASAGVTRMTFGPEIVESWGFNTVLIDEPWAIVLHLPPLALKKDQAELAIGAGQNGCTAEIYRGPNIHTYIRVPGGPATPPLPENNRYVKEQAIGGRVLCRILNRQRYPAVEIEILNLRSGSILIPRIGPFRTKLRLPPRV